MAKIKVSAEEAKKTLSSSGKLFLELFKHGSLSVEIYKPEKVDNQQPHERDEIYVVISGSGIFFCNEERISFSSGDFLFVPAHIEHRFENFSDDFITWVFFYGPQGGEAF